MQEEMEWVICWFWRYWGWKKDSKQQQQRPPSSLLCSSSSHPKPPTHPALLSPSYLCQGPAGTTVYLGGNTVTSGVV